MTVPVAVATHAGFRARAALARCIDAGWEAAICHLDHQAVASAHASDAADNVAITVHDSVTAVECGLWVEGVELGDAASQMIAALAVGRLDGAQGTAGQVIDALSHTVDVHGGATSSGKRRFDVAAVAVEALLEDVDAVSRDALEASAELA
jgi:hypothetical protein